MNIFLSFLINEVAIKGYYITFENDEGGKNNI